MSCGSRPSAPPARGCRRRSRARCGGTGRDEDALGVRRGELRAAVGRAGLVQHRRALRRRLGQMDAGDREVPPSCSIGAPWRGRRSARRRGRAAPRRPPRSPPTACRPPRCTRRRCRSGRRVGLIVSRPMVARRAVEIAGDDVPADAALGEVVERRHPPRERVRGSIGRRRRDAEPEVLGDGRHRRHHQQRVVHRHLRTRPQGDASGPPP